MSVLGIVAGRLAGLERERLLRWTIAFCGLSAAWLVKEGNHPKADLAVIELSRRELERG